MRAAAGGLRSTFLGGEGGAAADQPPAAGPHSPQPQRQQQWEAGAAAAQPAAPQTAGPADPQELRQLQPRPSPLDPSGHLQAILDNLFPPGMPVPYELGVARAVAEVAAAAHASLPGVLAVVLPPGVAPPPGMVPIAVLDPSAVEALGLAIPQPPGAEGEEGAASPGGRWVLTYCGLSGQLLLTALLRVGCEGTALLKSWMWQAARAPEPCWLGCYSTPARLASLLAV